MFQSLLLFSLFDTSFILTLLVPTWNLHWYPKVPTFVPIFMSLHNDELNIFVEVITFLLRDMRYMLSNDVRNQNKIIKRGSFTIAQNTQ